MSSQASVLTCVVTTVALALMPAVARAQDLSAAAFVLLPPLVLAPLVAAALRMNLQPAGRGGRRSLWASLAFAWLEVPLWLAFGFFAGKAFFAGRWYLPALVMLVVTVAACTWLGRRFLHTAGRPSTPRVLLYAALLPVSFVVLVAVTVGVLSVAELIS